MSLSKEAEIEKQMTESLKSYDSIYESLLSVYQELRGKHGELPQTFVGRKNEHYEDYILKAANCKHQAIELWRDSTGSFESLIADYDYYEAQMQLYLAESFLQEHGFERSTDKLRESFVKTSPLIKDLIKTRGKLKSLSGASEKLVKAFENDETNCRRLLERQTKYSGV
jgi:hypothetical protein